jgi:hypothetical protein
MSRPDSRQPYIPLVVFAVATALYLLTMQRMICGDGIFFDEMLQAGLLMNIHLLQLPLAWSLQATLSVFVDVSPETAMKMLSALTGGFGVAVTYGVARQVLGSTAQALAAALTLMVLAGYWFHATATELHALHPACATVLLAGLVRAIRAGERGDAALDTITLTCCAAGSLMTPLSHASGVAMGLPTLYVIWKLPPRLRWQLLIAVAGGSLAFGVIFGLSYWLSVNVQASLASASDAATGMSMMSTIAMFKQWLLYAIPVSVLVPAGLGVLFRTAPKLAWFSLLWIVAWPIAALRHTDFLFGSYHTPTFPVQVIVAVVALRQLARTPLRAVLVMVLAAVPMVGLLARDTAGLAPDNLRETMMLCPAMDDLEVGLLLWLLAATTLVTMTRGSTSHDEPARPRWLPILPLATLLLSAPFLAPILRGDPYRDLVIYLPESFSERNHWRRFFRIGDKERGFSPADKEYLPVNLESYRGAITRARMDNLRVWFVGEIDTYSEGTKLLHIPPDKEVMEFFAYLRETYRFARPQGTAEPIYELLPKN